MPNHNLTIRQMQGYRNNFLGAVRLGNMNGAEVTVDIATAQAVLVMLDQAITPAAASHADINLCEPTAETLIKFCTSIIRRAVGDHLGRKRQLTEGANIHGIGPDVGGGPNPHYVAPEKAGEGP